MTPKSKEERDNNEQKGFALNMYLMQGDLTWLSGFPSDADWVVSLLQHLLPQVNGNNMLM